MAPDSRPLFPLQNCRRLVRDVLDRRQQDSSLLPTRDLTHRVLLHLPRIPAGSMSRPVVEGETERLATRSWRERERFADRVPPPTTVLLDELDFREIDVASVDIVVRYFHYIGMPRPAIVGLGACRSSELARHDELPLAMLTLSEFDLGNITERCPALTSDSAVVLSRVYAFPNAPYNCLTRLLRHARAWLKAQRPRVDWLVTYINPNLGFTGTTYRADNWTLLGEEPFETYYDASGDYVTPRALHDQLIGADRSVVGSQWQLQPLQLWIRPVQGAAWSTRPMTFGTSSWSRRIPEEHCRT